MTRCAAALLGALLAFGLFACARGESSSGSATIDTADGRPRTSARLQFVTPAPDATEPPDFTLDLALTGARVTTVTSGALTSDEGHIHVSLDGKLISMTFGTTQALTDLTPGRHSLQAEFVAKDHAPFANRPRAFVQFTVR
jgi:hypothetical protein